MLYCAPLLTVIGTAIVVPVTVMGLETWTLDGAALLTAVKPPCSTGWAAVVTVNVELTPPMVTIADEVVLYADEVVTCSLT